MEADCVFPEEDIFIFPITDDALESAAGKFLGGDTEMQYTCYVCITASCPPR